MKTYVTFGQAHTHLIGDKIFDRNSVAVIDSKDAMTGCQRAFELFGNKFCTTYTENDFNIDDMKYFPRGFIDVS
jgi:hypothetical protein